MVDGIKKYNPAFLSSEELTRSFVVRHKELDMIVQTIRHNTTESNQHILVMGPRGIGKTMLVLRVAEEIRRDEDLNKKWYPLVFAEESYSVSTPGEFWLEAIFHLAHQTGEKKWNETYEELNAEQNEQRLQERALAQLMDFADSQGKRILLIVENLNMLLGDQISHEDAWVLRKTLLSEPRIMLLATATSQFRWEKKGNLRDETENLEKAFFELFQQYKLMPLNESECRILWTSITGKDSSDERIRPLQILTGGNLRLLTIISTFASQMSLRELMKDLLNLVDENTEYFKSHLDSLPLTERKAYLALAELWDPSSSREVAKVARLEVSKTSALLLRLIERGAVVEVKETGRTKKYQVAERMYNIYYLMRRPGAPSMRVKALVKFMTHFYEPEDLVKTANRIAEEACGLKSELRGDHYLAYEAIIENATNQNLRKKLLETTPKNFFKQPDIPTSLRLLIKGREDEQIKTVNGDKEVQALLEKVYILSQKPDSLSEAEKLCRKAIEIATRKARPYMALGLLLGDKQGRYKNAENAYRKALELEPEHAWIWTRLGQLLYEKLGRYNEAEKAYRKAIELEPEVADVWIKLGVLLYEKLGRYDDAEKAYRKAIELKPESAQAWAGLGLLLHIALGRYDEAEIAYRKALDLEPETAAIWGMLGLLFYDKLGRYDEAEKAYRKGIELKPEIATIWGALGELLHEKLGRYDEAEKAYLKVIDLEPEAARNWAKLGQLLHEKLGRYDEAEKAYRKAIELKPKIAWGWVALGKLLYDKLGRYDEAEKVLRKAIEICSDVYLPLESLVILLLKNSNRSEETVKLCEYYIAKDSQDVNGLRNEMAWVFYEHAPKALLKYAEGWAREAVKMKPNNAYYKHTLASILCASGKEAEALEHAGKYLEDIKAVENTVNDGIELFVELAARGVAKEAIKVLQDSPSTQILEPLIVGLRLFIGEDVQVATEIAEIGKDVAERIRKRQKEIQGIKS
ncbi:MAG: tetratricopeptide repeat protein [Sedimentisphaerales bacterium]